MLTRIAVVTGLLAVAGSIGAEAQKPLPESVTKQIQELKKELPGLKEAQSELETAAAPPSGTAPLPEPSLTEPFEIGEALYDPGRAANAVVSLLSLMRIAVVPDTNASTRAPAGITLSESEVHALINLAREDLQGADDLETLPHSFADLYAAVAELLPGMSIEQLAEAYTNAYQARPEDLIAKALMGQPIEPETKLTRAQIWFLLMDGFAGAAAPSGRWGTADKQIPDLKPPNAQWSAEEFREVLARLPLVTASRLVTVSAPDVISTGATASGPPVNVTARVAAAAPPLVSRLTGRTLLAPRAGSLSGQKVTWLVRDESMLKEIGKIVSPVDTPVPIGANGLAQFVFQPGADPTKGAGQLVDEWETLEASFETSAVVASAYGVPGPLAGLAIGTSRARANVHLRWRSSDVLYLWVTNIYTGINFEIPGLGGGTRTGIDWVLSRLNKKSDKLYEGDGNAMVTASQTLRGGAVSGCQTAEVNRKQIVRVKAERQTGFGPTHVLDDFLWADAQLNPVGTMSNPRPDGGYFRLIFYPRTAPPFGRPCISNIPATGRGGWGADYFIPFNDAQWTTSMQGYGIALKAQGPTVFWDTSSGDPLGLVLPGVKALFQLTGNSLWLVVVTRSAEEMLSIIDRAFK